MVRSEKGTERILRSSAFRRPRKPGRLVFAERPDLVWGLIASLFVAMGTIAAKPSVVELSMLVLFGALGFLMRRFDYPVAPMVVGLIVGPMAETQLRRALSISLGDPLVILESPIAAGLLAVAALALLAPFVMRGLDRFKATED
jgi:putative tricarboxylic transport membrane protein